MTFHRDPSSWAVTLHASLVSCLSFPDDLPNSIIFWERYWDEVRTGPMWMFNAATTESLHFISSCSFPTAFNSQSPKNSQTTHPQRHHIKSFAFKEEDKMKAISVKHPVPFLLGPQNFFHKLLLYSESRAVSFSLECDTTLLSSFSIPGEWGCLIELISVTGPPHTWWYLFRGLQSQTGRYVSSHLLLLRLCPYPGMP